MSERGHGLMVIALLALSVCSVRAAPPASAPDAPALDDGQLAPLLS